MKISTVSNQEDFCDNKIGSNAQMIRNKENNGGGKNYRGGVWVNFLEQEKKLYLIGLAFSHSYLYIASCSLLIYISTLSYLLPL